MFKTRSIYPHPLNLDNAQCIAVARGPFIYCAETVDNAHISDLRAIRIPDGAEFLEESLDTQGLEAIGFDRDGVSGIGGKAIILRTKAHIIRTKENVGDADVTLTLVPYFMWANRGKSNHRVWLPRA